MKKIAHGPGTITVSGGGDHVLMTITLVGGHEADLHLSPEAASDLGGQLIDAAAMARGGAVWRA